MKIGEEGKVTTDGRLIIRGALRWANPVPVTIPGKDGQWIVGTATITRIGDEIHADVALDPGTLTFEVSADEYGREDEQFVLKDGGIRNIVIGGKSAWSNGETDG